MARTNAAESPTIVGANRLVTYGLLAVLLASVANGLVRTIALTVVDVPLVFPLWWEPVLAASAIGAAGATVVYGVITRVSKRPNRTFTVVAAFVFLVSFVGPVNALLSPPPELADAPWTVFATLAVMHVTAAVAIVGVLTRATTPEVASR